MRAPSISAAAVGFGKSFDERVRLGGPGDPIAAPPDRGQGEALGGIGKDLGPH
jgi:hypothetical protein